MKKIVFLANRDFVLYNFRFELIKKLIDEKHEVAICLPYGPKVELMTNAGAKYIPLDIEGRGKNILKDIIVLKKLKRIFTEYKPDIILMYTTKIDIYGGIVASKLGIPYILNISGLGTATGEHGILQHLMLKLYRIAVNEARCVFFQNKENMAFFHSHNITPTNEIVIPGSGVNVARWPYLEYPGEEKGIHFLFIARVIKQKGIEDYLSAAKEIVGRYNYAFFHIIGPCDGHYKNILRKYEKKGIIQYHGMVQDTSEYLKKAHCTIHPSYYPEGISNVCLESAASGRPVITTDNPGCRDTVDDGVSGYIIRGSGAMALVKEVERFLHLPWDKKKEMGVRGRLKVQEEFNRDKVVDEYMRELKSFLE